jgi:alkanesulfonate monooxygenase SsuD/methylene tetrahydromethanopterin reductase-like flavin-dependent oxidoreductase (luciferase family)
MATMKVSFKTGIQDGSWDELLAVWQTGDKIERFAGGWSNDHLYNPFYPEHADSPHAFDAFTLLAGLARETTRLRLGTMVAANLVRHPAVVARMAVTIDHLSGGRFELGLGTGWHEREHADHGIDLLPVGARVTAFEEACQVITSLLTEEETTLSGEFYFLDRARSEPKPLQDRIPIVVGASGEQRMLRIVARYADHWNIDDPAPEVLAHKIEVLERHCAEVGRDPADIEFSVQLWVDDNTDGLRDKVVALRDVGAEHAVVSLRRPDAALLEAVAETLADV